MGLGLDSAGRRPGLGLELQAEGRDWPGLSTEVPYRTAANREGGDTFGLRSTCFHLLWLRHNTAPIRLRQFRAMLSKYTQFWTHFDQNQCHNRDVAGPCMRLNGTGP